MKLLVCGAGGMLGGDLVAAAQRADHEVLALPREALDVGDPAATAAAVREARPDAVLNCAGYTDVDGAESRPEAALRVNGEGARHVAAAAAAVGAAVVYPSSDYVFDGRKREPYVESDPTGPLSSYGRSKLAGERETAAANPRHFVVRSAWLYGTGGRNFVEAMLELASRNGDLKVVDDQVGSPTYTRHLAEGILRLLARDDYGVHHMAGSGACSWYEFAREIFGRAGLRPELRPCSSEEFPRPAKRPAYSVLESEREGAIRLPDWHSGLEGYLAERA